MAESQDPVGQNPDKQNADRPRHRGGRAVFGYPSFVRYMGARLLTVLALQMQSVAVGWQVYEITRSPLALGLTGLAQFLPGILLFLISGHAADRIPRRKLMVACFAGFTVCSGALVWIQKGGVHSAGPIYFILVALGITRAFSGPAMRALVPLLVPAEHFPSGVAWEASMTQTATVLGPAAGGFLYALFHGPGTVYAIVDGHRSRGYFFRRGNPGARAVTFTGTSEREKRCSAGTALPSGGRKLAWAGFAGPFCRASGRSGRAAARLRGRHPANGALGAGTAAQRTWSGRGNDGRSAGAQATTEKRARPCCGAWRALALSHGGFWALAKFRAFSGIAFVRGRHGHGGAWSPADARATQHAG